MYTRGTGIVQLAMHGYLSGGTARGAVNMPEYPHLIPTQFAEVAKMTGHVFAVVEKNTLLVKLLHTAQSAMPVLLTSERKSRVTLAGSCHPDSPGSKG